MKNQIQKRTVTLKDVAEKTGYSVNTVSRALRGKDDISEATVDRIKKAAKEMGYINNTIASSLRLGYTNTIAVILGDISNPHFAIMTKEIENYARQHGYSAFLLNTNEDSENELRAIKNAINKNVDGIIICPVQENEDNTRFLIESGVPFIQIGRKSTLPEVNYVICDDVMGGYQATDYLLKMGHQKILFLNAPSYISSARERQEGYCKAYKEHGLEYDPNMIREISVADSNVSAVMEQVCEEKLDFTAIFGFSDSVAWEAWTWLHKCGKRVPEDYSLIGFDHIQSKMAIPFQLTTIGSYKTKMSVMAVECLIRKMRPDKNMKEECVKIDHQVIETIFIEGETVKTIK